MSGDVTFIKDEIIAMSRDMKEGFTAIHIRQDIANGRTGKAEVSLSNIEIQKQVNVRNISDHEARLRKLETYTFMAIGALALLQIAFKFLI